jgi:hypothetical protein
MLYGFIVDIIILNQGHGQNDTVINGNDDD